MKRTILGIGSLMLLWAICGPISAQLKEPSLPKGQWPQQVVGRGLTEDSAREVALREAVKTVATLMKQQDPPMKSFVVSEDYVRENLLTDAWGHAGKEIRIPGFEQPFKEWIFNFKTDHNWWKDIARRDQAAERKMRVEAHQTLASRTVLCLSILLLAGFGYVRLDSFTRHRYTTWLRVAGVSTASLALGVWWLVAGALASRAP